MSIVDNAFPHVHVEISLKRATVKSSFSISGDNSPHVAAMERILCNDPEYAREVRGISESSQGISVGYDKAYDAHSNANNNTFEPIMEASARISLVVPPEFERVINLKKRMAMVFSLNLMRFKRLGQVLKARR
ncbi:hypothetical protein F0562_013755 [Nyssa sinensis]|uniref:Uncharacterized protein n=1 Tax=Nyssa sinensis TaxID=561372 RepID=A0A5J4ZNF5_9ASTE|nr:hypothetical protein F0562_013755 [Nyssa sinensis]